MEEQKNAKFHLNNDEAGNVEAVFSVFDMIDSDGDVVVKGAVKSGFPKSDLVPMVWSHDWKQPVGKGYIIDDGTKAVFKGNFFMDTEAGQEAYKLVKNMGELQQWSFGYEVNDSEQGEFKDKDGNEKNVRYLKSLSVFEVSPVLVGANRETYTLAVKNAVLSEEGEIKQEIQKEDLEEMISEKEGGVPAEIVEEGSLETVGEKGHTPVHTVQQAVGQIAEDLKDIMGKLPKDENAPLPSWWVDGMKMIASKANKYRDYFIDPKFMEMEGPEEMDEPKPDMEEDGWHDDEKGLKDDNQIASTVMSRTFAEHVESLIEDITMFKQRVISLAQLRAEKNKKLGKSASEGVAQVANTLEDTFRDLDDLLNEDVLPVVDEEVEIAEAEVEVADTAELAEDAVQEVAQPEATETTEIVDEKPLTTEEAVQVVEDNLNLEQQINEASSEQAFNELFINSQAAVARALGVEIEDSVIDGDNNSE